jgi:hypothetical protein
MRTQRKRREWLNIQLGIRGRTSLILKKNYKNDYRL